MPHPNLWRYSLLCLCSLHLRSKKKISPHYPCILVCPKYASGFNFIFIWWHWNPLWDKWWLLISGNLSPLIYKWAQLLCCFVVVSKGSISGVVNQWSLALCFLRLLTFPRYLWQIHQLISCSFSCNHDSSCSRATHSQFRLWPKAKVLWLKQKQGFK